jgi:hypothetical protein
MSIRQYAPTPTKTLTRTSNNNKNNVNHVGYYSPSQQSVTTSSSMSYYNEQQYHQPLQSPPPSSTQRSNAHSRATNVSGWGWASPSNSRQQGRTPVPPAPPPNKQQYTPIRHTTKNDYSNYNDNGRGRHIKQQQGTQTPSPSTTYINRQAEKHKKRMEKKSKRPGYKKEQIKVYGRVQRRKKHRAIQFQPNDYIDFPRYIIAIEGPGNVENITKDVANYMGWYHICLEDLLIHCDDPLCQDAITNIAQGLPVNLQSLYVKRKFT